jgi:type II secretory pathway pseudopilin PulG
MAVCASQKRRPRTQAGFGLVEVLFSAAILVIAVMGNASSVSSSHSGVRQVTDRSKALEVFGRFLEQLRGDEDWGGLYARLRTRTAEGAQDANLTHHGVDPSLATHAPTVYYADFTLPTDLGTVTFLVQVPASRAGAGTPLTLRENLVAPRYGLPADLNGDGTIASDSRESDYRALPVVIRMRWTRSNGAAEELVLPTWLRGER